MFSFESLKHVQVEITNRCQASCPMCLRNIHGGIENPNLVSADWSVDQFKNIFNKEVLLQIQTINFCGDFGDPILNKDLLDMCRYVKDYSNAIIYIHTNGSARSTQWWELLAQALPKNHKVVFAIDGLQDTHQLYRIGTDFHNIINNADSFIQAGGNAEWCFIKFKHNEHQVEDAEQLSKKLNFKNFTVKHSKRFGKQFPVLDRQGKTSHYIEQPVASNIQPVEFIDLKNYKEWKTDVTCFALDSKELYIDANGYLMPCCLIGSFLYANYDVALYDSYGLIDSTSITGIAYEVQQQVFELIREFGGLAELDAKLHSIKDIMNRPIWQELVHKKWADDSLAPCKILCGNQSPFIRIEQQIINRA